MTSDFFLAALPKLKAQEEKSEKLALEVSKKSKTTDKKNYKMYNKNKKHQNME